MQNINVVYDTIKVKQKYNKNCSRPFAPYEKNYLILNQYYFGDVVKIMSSESTSGIYTMLV